MNIAVLSDTHGLLRAEVLPYLQNVEAIIHAGDVGKASILEQLRQVAPTFAVRGNVDTGAFGEDLPTSLRLEFEGAALHVLHDIDDWQPTPTDKNLRLVIFGHSHKPAYYESEGLHFLNPGAIGPRRFKLPISFALLDWKTSSFDTRFITFAPTS